MEKVIDELVDALVDDFKESIVVLDAMGAKIELHPCICMFMSAAVLVMKKGNRPKEEIDYIKYEFPKRLRENSQSKYEKIISKLKK